MVAFANAGGDMVDSVKQAHEFGLVAGGQQRVVLAANASACELVKR